MRVAVVDYRGVKGNPSYAQTLNALAESRPEALTSNAERAAFWVNAYNLAAIKAVLDEYPTRSIKEPQRHCAEPARLRRRPAL